MLSNILAETPKKNSPNKGVQNLSNDELIEIFNICLKENGVNLKFTVKGEDFFLVKNDENFKTEGEIVFFRKKIPKKIFQKMGGNLASIKSFLETKGVQFERTWATELGPIGINHITKDDQVEVSFRAEGVESNIISAILVLEERKLKSTKNRK